MFEAFFCTTCGPKWPVIGSLGPTCLASKLIRPGDVLVLYVGTRAVTPLTNKQSACPFTHTFRQHVSPLHHLLQTFSLSSSSIYSIFSLPITMPVDHDVATELIESRLQDYTMLGFESLTPLLKQLLQQSSEFHSQALKLPVIHKHLMRELNTFHHIVEEHWGKVHNSLARHAQLIAHMLMFMAVLSSALVRDYCRALAREEAEDGEYVAESHVKLIKQHRESGRDSNSEDSEQSYQDLVVAPVEELMLDHEHVENRFMAAAETCNMPKGSIPGTVHYFIKRCDWPGLANTLVRDRELALAILDAGKQSSTMLGLFPKDDAIKVVQGISDIRDKYFTDLSSPTDFTLSKHAKKQSPPSSSDQTSASETRTVGQYLKPDRSAWASARSIADSIKGHLGDVRSRVRQGGAQTTTGEEAKPLLVTGSKKEE